MVVEATFSTKHSLRTPTARHRKTGPEQTLDTSSGIKTTIHADSKSLTLKPKELATLSSRYGIHRSTKPFSITLNLLNCYSFLNFNQISSKSIAMTIAIRGVSFRYPLRPILKLGPIHTTLRKRLTLLRTPLQTVRTRLQTKVSIRHRKVWKSRKNHWDADIGSTSRPQRPAKTLSSPVVYTAPYYIIKPDSRNRQNWNRPDRPQTNPQIRRKCFQ